MKMREFDIVPLPREREIVVDAGRLASRRHIIHCLLEADVTRARELLRAAATGGGSLSFTAFVVASFARAIGEVPTVQAYRGRGRRLVVFHDVDVVTMIEPTAGAVAIPHIVRATNRKTVREISDELRSIQLNPEGSEQRGGLVALAPRVPWVARSVFYWALRRNPRWFKRLGGTAIVTSVGMFGKGGGWGLGFLPMHTLGLTVGGIAEKPGVHEGAVAIREYVNLTLSFDHDIVDGAPAARFAKVLRDLIEAATVLEEGNAGR
jgi:pyruvate/2-oxoglutarate dehydrogenase complex dihydrolipoamide acyltransferase (E2) component